MPQTSLLVIELKRALKERGLTYRDVAKSLRLSEASIKRCFAKENFSLRRLQAVCELAQLDLVELMQRSQAAQPRVSQLTAAQEDQLMADPKLFLLAYQLLNRRTVADIEAEFEFEPRELRRLLLRLARLGMLDLLPGNRVRMLLSRHFTWRFGGPVQRFVESVLMREFFAADFAAPLAEFRFFAASLSEHSLAQMKRSLQRIGREFDAMAEEDAALPSGRRQGAAAVLAVRPWNYSGFAQLRRSR